MSERLQKIIARAGITSRRASEELIQAGRVRVNGRIVTELGAKADPRRDAIEVDGRRLVAESARYIVLHKPRNVVSTMSDPEGRPTVAELLQNAGTRLYPVGRLDFATSGVLLATNDGDFANGMLHPRGGVPKTYVLKVKGNMAEEDLMRWSSGVELEDGKTLPADVRLIRHEEDKTWFEITIREGRNQQIRRMGEATGFPVMRLARVSFAGITHEGLRPGDWRSLTVEELEDLRKQYGVPKRIRGAALGEHAEAPRRPRRPQRAGHAPSGDRAAPRAGRGQRWEEEAAPRGRGGQHEEGRGARGRGERAPLAGRGEQAPRGRSGERARTGEQAPRGRSGERARTGEQVPRGRSGERARTGEQAPRAQGERAARPRGEQRPPLERGGARPKPRAGQGGGERRPPRRREG
jgi:23S rRNA pseudouridine2605 synthase